VANYNVDIAIALKNSNKLITLRRELVKATDKIREFNKEAREQNKVLPVSINSFNKQLTRARKLLDRAAVGTASFTRAAKALVNVEKEQNNQLIQRERILRGIKMARSKGLEVDPVLKSIKRNQSKGRTSQKSSSGFLGFSQSADKILGDKIVFQKRQELELQQALLALEIKSAAKQNEKLQLIGEVNRQTAQAVNNARFRGQSSPFTSDIRGNIGDVKSRIEGNTLASRRAKFRNVFGGVSGRDFGQIGGRIGPVEPIRSEGGFLAFSKKADEIARGVKANVKQTTKAAQLLSQQATRASFEDIGFGIKGGQIGPERSLNRFEKAGFGKRGSSSGLFSFPGGKSSRIKGGIGSALIGGGFPALFGAGGISSLLGGLAGGIGGALAPGGGFAASIAATAIAAQIEKAIQFRKAVKKLNEEVAAMGISSEFSRKNIKKLAKDFDVTNDEAVKLASTVKTFGEKQGLAILETFGSREIFDALAGLRDTSSVLGKINQLQQEISESKRQELLQSLATEGPLKTQVKLEQIILDKKRKSFIEDKKREELVKKLDEKYGGGSYLGVMPDKNQESPEQQLKRLNQEFDKSNEKQIKFLENQIKINEQMQFLSEFNAPTDQLREMLNPMRQILDLSVAIKDGFENSFKGIIKGTMSVQDAFRSMLNKIADHFLDAAARMAATQLQKGFLGLFSNMFNFTQAALPTNPVELGGLPSSPSNIVPSLSNTTPSNFMIPSSNPFTRANGGSVKGGNGYLVGERGPELFTPGVSGMITPNEMLGGGTNIVVNVDASGSSVEGDEEQGRELGRMISVAIQSELIKQKRPGGLLT